MKSVEEAPGHQGGVQSIEAINAEIALAKARLDELMAQKSRVSAAALPLSAELAVPLYTWQQQALANWRATGCRGVVQAVTGAGKTRVGVAAIAGALNAGQRAVVIVPTLVLVKQWVATLQELLPSVPVSDRLGDPKPWRVLVTTIQSAMNRAPIPYGERALLVVDEVHRAGAEGFSLALRSGFESRLGLTATLERGDDGDEILRGYFGDVVFDLGYQQALADQLIADFRFAQVSVPLLPPEQVRYTQLTDDLRGARDRLIRQHGMPSESVSHFLRAVSDLARDRASTGSGLARYYMKIFSERRSLLAETPVKMVVLEALSEAIQQANGTIVFTQTRESSDQAARVLSDAGCSSASVHGELDKDSREERIDLFREGGVTALTAPRVLDEGVDLPDADLGIVTAANRSRRQMIQRLGRVLRRREGKLARFVVLYAAGTVEDPTASGYIPDFYDACLPFAESSRTFDLNEKGQLGDLLEFLGVEGAADAELPHRAGPADSEETLQARPPRSMTPRPERERVIEMIPPDGDDDEPAALLGKVPLKGDPVKYYLAQIGQYPLLDAEDEVALGRSMEAGHYARHLMDSGDDRFQLEDLKLLEQRGCDARERMICSNLRLVVSLAKRYRGSGMEFLDLIQEGNIGLIHAVDKFDYKLGNKFSTYATWWIRQAITRGMADRSATIRIPVHMHEKKLRVERLRREQNLSWDEFSNQYPDGLPELDVTGEEIKRLARLSRPVVSTEGLAELVDDSIVYTRIDEREPLDEVSQFIDRKELEQRVTAVLRPLEHEDPRTAFVLKARFGLLTGEPETLDLVGQRIGVTRERVRQLVSLGLRRLREISEEQENWLLRLARERTLAESFVPTPQMRANLVRAAVLKRLRSGGSTTATRPSVTAVKPSAAISKEAPRASRHGKDGGLGGVDRLRQSFEALVKQAPETPLQAPASPRRADTRTVAPEEVAVPRRALP